MREIKFRAWHKSRCEMLPIIDIEYLMTKGALVTDYKDFVENIYPNIMQYTGLKDKNEVEIYESDIVKVLVAYTDYDGCEYKRPSSVYNHKTKYVNIAVSFEDGTFILDTDYTDSLDHTLWLWTQEDVEIIGNIYENEELLS